MFVRSSKRLVWAALLTWVVISTGSVAHAQQKPTEAAIALAREIIALKGATGMVDLIVPGVIDKVRSMHLQTNPMLSKPLAQVAAQLRKEFAGITADLQADAAAIYASRFTDAELKQILAFYKSSAGQKVIKEEPVLFETIIQQLNSWQVSFGEEVLKRFRAEMKKRGHEL
jgi:hypothetical protein